MAKAAAAPAPPDWNQYMALIQADPLYQKEVSDLNAQSVADGSQMGTGILGALANRGVVPDLAGSASKLGLSPAIVAWIQKNVNLGQAKALANQANAAGLSAQSQLASAHQTNLGSIRDSLAARGMLSSGANPFLMGQEEKNYATSLYGADKALADYISGAYSAFTNNEQGRQASLETALENAYTRAQQNQGSTLPAAPASATPTPTAPSGPYKAV